MAMTDPIADLLTRIRNAARARHQKVSVPWSRVKENIVKVLIEEGYLKEQKKVKANVGRSRVKENIVKVLIEEGYLKEQKKVKANVGWGEELIIQLKFDREHRPIITGLKRVSSPGRRVYVGAHEATPVRTQ